MQKNREKKPGIPALLTAKSTAHRAGDGEGEKEDLVLQDTFAQETAVTVEDPHMYPFFNSTRFYFSNILEENAINNGP